jgi:hypothetical protein
MSFARQLTTLSAYAAQVITLAASSARRVIRVLTDPAAAGSGRFYRVRQW